MKPNTTVEETIQEQPKLEVAPVDKMDAELAKQNVTEKAIAEMRAKFMTLKVTGIDDKAGYAAVHEARMQCKNTRVLASKICKAGREDAIAEQKAWIAKEKEITGKISEVEDYLQSEQKKIDDEKERIKQAEIEAARLKTEGRVALLISAGCLFNGTMYELGNLEPISLEGIKVMPDNVWADLLNEVTAESDRLDKIKAEEEARLKAEADRLEQEKKAEEERMQKEREELEKLKAEQQEREEAIKAEQQKIEDEKAALAKAKVKSRATQLEQLGLRYDSESETYCMYDADNNAAIIIHEPDLMNLDGMTWDSLIYNTTEKVAEIGVAIKNAQIAEQQRLQEEAAQAERNRIEAEKKAEEERLAQEKAAKEHEEAMRPDKDKLLTLGNTIVQIQLPEVNSEEAKAILKNVQDSLNKIQASIVRAAKSL